MRTFWQFLADESGATAIEYALIAAGLALATLASLNAMGTAFSNVFDSAKTALN